MDNFRIKTNYQSTQNSNNLKPIKLLLLTDGSHVDLIYALKKIFR